MLYDITRPVNPGVAVWPGDTPYSTHYVMQIKNGDSVNVSAVTCSAHTGTHADAPYHFDEDGLRIGEVDLEPYLGPATLIDLSEILPDGGPVEVAHLKGGPAESARRILVRSRASQRADSEWDEKIIFLSCEAAHYLASKNVRLFGTDAPSVDPLESRTMDAHHILAQNGIAILETLQLKDVPVGEYELIALPLKLDNDGSPVRAVLRTLTEEKGKS